MDEERIKDKRSEALGRNRERCATCWSRDYPMLL